jgi:hypothetical protein
MKAIGQSYYFWSDRRDYWDRCDDRFGHACVIGSSFEPLQEQPFIVFPGGNSPIFRNVFLLLVILILFRFRFLSDLKLVHVTNNEMCYTTVKTLYNDTGFFAVRIVIPKVSLYSDFVYKTHQTLKLCNNIVYL